MKVGIVEEGRTIWFEPRHYRLAITVVLAMWRQARQFEIVFR